MTILVEYISRFIANRLKVVLLDIVLNNPNTDYALQNVFQ